MTQLALIVSDNETAIAVGDVLRSMCAVGAAALIGLALALVWRTSVRAKTSGPVQVVPHEARAAARDLAFLLLGFALLAVSALFTELGRLGEPVSWRLPFNIGGIVLGLIGVTRLLTRVRHT